MFGLVNQIMTHIFISGNCTYSHIQIYLYKYIYILTSLVYNGIILSSIGDNNYDFLGICWSMHGRQVPCSIWYNDFSWAMVPYF